MIDATLQATKDWIGRSRTVTGLITAAPADILAATLDRDDRPLGNGDEIPPGWHWCYFPEVVKLSETGPDGHAAKGGFMPAAPLPRRMWAGVEMSFRQPLRVGQEVRRVSTIADVALKEGRAGALCFVTVRHEIFGPDGLTTVEDHDTVYRGLSAAVGAAPAARTDRRTDGPPAQAVWRREIRPDPVLLFRYSALTMNSHRIHYDRDYVTGVEGYPGLMVHGNLIATLLLDLFRRERPAARLKSFAVRARSPLYDAAPFTVAGAPDPGSGSAKLWAVSPGGVIAQSATVTFQA